MSMDGQGTKCRRNIIENLNRLSRAHEPYRRQTDGRPIAYSEREREFTFAKNLRNFQSQYLKTQRNTVTTASKLVVDY